MSKKLERRWEWRGDSWVVVVCFVRVYSTVKVLSLYITLWGVKRHDGVQKHKTQYSMTAGNGNSVFYRNKTESNATVLSWQWAAR